MDVKVEFVLEIVGSEFAKVSFVPNDRRALADAVKSSDETQGEVEGSAEVFMLKESAEMLQRRLRRGLYWQHIGISTTLGSTRDGSYASSTINCICSTGRHLFTELVLADLLLLLLLLSSSTSACSGNTIG